MYVYEHFGLYFINFLRIFQDFCLGFKKICANLLFFFNFYVTFEKKIVIFPSFYRTICENLRDFLNFYVIFRFSKLKLRNKRGYLQLFSPALLFRCLMLYVNLLSSGDFLLFWLFLICCFTF